MMLATLGILLLGAPAGAAYVYSLDGTGGTGSIVAPGPRAEDTNTGLARVEQLSDDAGHIAALGKKPVKKDRSDDTHDMNGKECQPIPAGKKLAVAGVWVQIGSNDSSPIDEFKAEDTACQMLLSLA